MEVFRSDIKARGNDVLVDGSSRRGGHTALNATAEIFGEWLKGNAA